MSEGLNRGTAIVTGASSGIGAVYANRLADRGYDLVLVARGRDRLAVQAAAISKRTGRKAEALPADLSTAEGTAAVVARLRSDPSVTLLVNNAGIVEGGPLSDADPDALETMIAINVQSLTRLSAAAAKAFVERKAGTIVNLSSILAILSNPGTSVYNATKAYVLHLSRGLADEVAPFGVRVQSVLPGYTRTPMLSDAVLARIPKEAVMNVDELVDAALAGLDAGEAITIPSLPDIKTWDAYEAARKAIADNGSRDHPAARYTVSVQVPALA